MSSFTTASVSGGSSSGTTTISLGSAGPISFTLTSPNVFPVSSNTASIMGSNHSFLTVPGPTDIMLATPPTPVLKAQTGGDSIPPLSLDSVPSGTSLVTSSPFTTNEGLTFAQGTSLWQAPTGTTSSRSSQVSTSLVTSSPFDTNEGLTIAPGTSLWQATGPSTTQQHASAAQGLWTPASTSAPKASNSSSSSMRPMGAPLPVSNLITSGPFAQNEGLVIPAGTSLWQPSTTAATKAHNSTGTPSLITASPYDVNEGLTFPEGTPFWQSKD
jgi:hypothetical protein